MHRGIRATIVAAATAVAATVNVGLVAGPAGASLRSSGSAHQETLGLLIDYSGPGSDPEQPALAGVKAGIYRAKQMGYHFKYVIGDTQTTSPLAAAQKLVLQDHVDAIIQVADLGSSAAPFNSSHGVPVFGENSDGTEWLTDKNYFSPDGPTDQSKVATTWGLVLKNGGATSVGSIGYDYGQATIAALNWAASAKAVGLKVGYVNSHLPLSTTNLEPVALQMKSNGVNGFLAATGANTYLALAKALRQSGGNLKTAIEPYDAGALAEAGPSAVQAAQGLTFFMTFEVPEMNTPATQRFKAALKATGSNNPLDLATYVGYTSVLEYVRGLQAAGGSNPSQAQVITAMNKVHDFNPDGLLGSHSLDVSNRTNVSSAGVDNCEWISELRGSTYKLVPNEDPICGKIVKGASIPSS
jgi:branched-chain amino acid transport system substrate-binding protein